MVWVAKIIVDLLPPSGGKIGGLVKTFYPRNKDFDNQEIITKK